MVLLRNQMDWTVLAKSFPGNVIVNIIWKFALRGPKKKNNDFDFGCHPLSWWLWNVGSPHYLL